MYYMLNLLFKYNDPNGSDQGGRFMEYVPPQPTTNLLTVSKAWLESIVTSPDENNPANWQLFQKDAEHLSFPASPPPNIWIRVADANQTGLQAQILILIARNTPNSNAPQTYSSPIVDPNALGRPLNSYASQLSFATPTGSNPLASWMWKPGQATLNSGISGTKNKYTMVVGAWVLGHLVNPKYPNQTFSHDPDMNIDV